MTLVAGFSAAITILSALPGAAATLEALYTDITNHAELSAEDKATLLATRKAQVDASDDRLQSLPATDPMTVVPA